MRRVPGWHSVFPRFNVVNRLLLHVPGLRGTVYRLLVSVGHHERHVRHKRVDLHQRAHRQPVFMRHLPCLHNVFHVRRRPGLLVQRLVHVLHCIVGRLLGPHDWRGIGLRSLCLPGQYV